MLNFFTDPYEDELISSIFARYHLYSGNIDRIDTLEELQGERNNTAFKMFPSRLIFLESQIENVNYTSDRFIYENTIFPLYSVFLYKNKHSTVINYMKERGSDKIHHILGISGSKVKASTAYRYCPMCAVEEINLYGEAYFHRTHQVPGVLVCEKHECSLFDYIEEYKSEIEFTRFKYDDIKMLKEPSFYEKNINEVLVRIAKAVKYIMQLDYLKYSREYVLNKLYELLRSREYMTAGGRVRQIELILDFNNYYEPKLLKLLNSEVKFNVNDWIRAIFVKGRGSSQPIRTILLILFLTNNEISKLFCEDSMKNLPFGEGPWPCLNPVCSFYKNDVINNINIYKSHNNRILNGVFICKHCGYAYRRKGPDKHKRDIYVKHKVLEFGDLWEREFKRAIERKDTYKDIMERFDIYSAFIYYYKKNNKFISREKKVTIGNIKDNFNEYSADIKEYMKKNKTCNRSSINKNMSRQVGWLKNNYPEWLEENLPKPRQRKNYLRTRKRKEIDKEFDNEILEEVKNIYNELILVQKNKRVTITLIERLLNKKINRKLDNLPKTKVFLEEILENVDQYSIRRVQEYCNQLLLENTYMNKSKIIKKTAISYSLISDECKKNIDSIISEYLRRNN